MALVRGQPGLGLPDPEVHLPPQQHVLLLLGVPHCDDRVREIPGGLPSLISQTNIVVKLKQTEVKVENCSFIKLLNKEYRKQKETLMSI